MPAESNRLHELPLGLRLGILAGIAIIALGCVRLIAPGPDGLGWAGIMIGGIGLTAASLAFGLLAGRMFSREPARTPMRNYNRRIAITMMIYVVLLMGSVTLFAHGWGSGPWGYLLAALPAIPVAVVFLVLGLYLKEETDEFARQLFMQACLIGAAVTFVEATFWGFLETFHKVPHVPIYAASIAFFAQYGVASCILWRRYR